MTNDDRSNEDRTGDGQASSWGGAPQQPAPSADEPRYGERVDPAPTSTPQYGEPAPQADAPRWGEQAQQYQAPQGETPQYGSTQYAEQQGQYGQPQHGQPQYGQQPYAAAPASAGAPSWQGYEEPKAKKKTVGVVAFVLGLVSLVVGVIGGWLMGAALASSDALRSVVPTDGSTPDQSQLQQQLMNDPNVVSQLGVGAIVAGIAALLGLWALVQGIVAIVTKRGRGWGVFAIILAVVATIATFATYIGVAAAAVVNGGS
ncbi:hypothetical protein [Curtobacterium sp. SORGH_AS_0776]|uniref:hypothetical protein n=1 Tax=Curtobacterium sp. SORGH_AS_0776 TaxID=3041798 RepID=UPI00285F064B|nr:hypothetical protein [Curtobacterium sp. SORGH_AS_0776]MDR6169497.1 hypothetical protein [Curtobacterium sp. SORGH_AS_0776]